MTVSASTKLRKMQVRQDGEMSAQCLKNKSNYGSEKKRPDEGVTKVHPGLEVDFEVTRVYGGDANKARKANY